MIHDSLGSSPVEWAGKPYPEVVDTAERDGSILVIPVGSLEQHGYHLPTATDTLLVDAIVGGGAERVADDLPVLVTPPVWTGYSPHHMSFGGTVTGDYDTLLALLEDTAASALENPFDICLFVNGHGGNRSLIGAATNTVGHDHPDVELFGLTYFTLGDDFVPDIRDSDIGGIVHGGELETAMMQHLRPDLVREDRIEGTHLDKPYSLMSNDLMEGGALGVSAEMRQYTDSGAIGDPELATAEKGKEAYENYCEATAELLREIHEKNR
jgi:creatinine amidohydrolase